MEHSISQEFFISLITTYSRQIPYIGSSSISPLKFKNHVLIITNICKTEKTITSYKAVPLSNYKGSLIPLRKEQLLADVVLNKREDPFQGMIVVIQNIQFLLTDKITLAATFENTQGLQLSI